jgi:hypothetical protein
MTSQPDDLGEAGTRVLAMLETGNAQPVRMLLDSARRAVRESAWESALYRSRAAIEQALRSGDTAAHASALVCEGCIELAMGDAERAAVSYFRGAQLFHLLAQPANEAAAALGYGYVNSVRGDPGAALDGYQRARTLLRALVASHNRAGNAERAERYRQRGREARDLMDRVLINPVIEAAPARTALAVVPVLALGQAAPPAGSPEWSEDTLPETQVLARELVVNGRVYTLHRAGGTGPLMLRPGLHYFACAAPTDGWARLGVQRGDYVLLCRERPSEERGFFLYRTASGAIDLGATGEGFAAAPGPRVFRESAVELSPLPESLEEPLIGFVVGILREDLAE